MRTNGMVWDARMGVNWLEGNDLGDAEGLEMTWLQERLRTLSARPGSNRWFCESALKCDMLLVTADPSLCVNSRPTGTSPYQKFVFSHLAKDESLSS